MKKIALLAALLFVMGGAFAQKSQRGVIYLKNGSEIKGRVIQADDQKTVVRSARNTWVFDNSEIETMASKWKSVQWEEEDKPWFMKTTVGVLAGSSDNIKSAPFSFDASFNYRLFSNIYAGLGAGIDFLEESYMPVFINLEYHFRDSHFTPFVGFQGGYLIPVDGDVTNYNNIYYASSSYWPYYEVQTLNNKGGIMLNPSFGFINHINQNLGFSVAFGYRFSRVTFEGDDSYELETNYNRLSIRLGIIFN